MIISLLCGGPSLERGISLNSARSVLDHLADENCHIVPIYFNENKKAYRISLAQLYCNTPADFDFKLDESMALDEEKLVTVLKESDLTFPVMHGHFGEDGGIQRFLEKNNLPFVGSGSQVCRQIFDKFTANQLVKELGFFTLPSAVLKIYGTDHQEIIDRFFTEHKITRAIVKPASGGSSIGVFSVASKEEALEKATLLFSKRMDTRVVIEPFATGKEFTVIILENKFGLPVAIIPSEIETDYSEKQFFDFRKKYLPTRQVTYHCPPRFDNGTVEKIQVQAEQLFASFGMRDFARFDGWVLPDGSIWFSDFNPISGMEQNSFLFQQASRIGLSHSQTLKYIVARACQRYGMKNDVVSQTKQVKNPKKRVRVLFGGQTSERQVSLMSGTNVWLKLLKSAHYSPTPFLLENEDTVWQLPYDLTLNHTVEEIIQNCNQAASDGERLADLENKIALRLAIKPKKETASWIPHRLSLQQFLDEAGFVFIALHGGIGEDGTLQKILEKRALRFNGSGSKASALCINKALTKERIRELGIEGVTVAKDQVVSLAGISKRKGGKQALWKELGQNLASKSIIVKPLADGCSSGVIRLYSSLDLQHYLDLIQFGTLHIHKNTFRNQVEIVELPLEPVEMLLFEEYIETDVIKIKNGVLTHKPVSGWLEITAGVIQNDGALKALLPSITIAEGEVLSVEEKFQGGTGVNLTPPPPSIMSPEKLALAQERIQRVATGLGIEGYARIDAFIHTATGNLIIIEANTLPGLTPSTVLYHQALAEKPAVFPIQFLESLIQNNGY